MSLADRGREIAARLFQKNAFPVTITRSVPGVATDEDRAAGRPPADVTQAVATLGVIVDREVKLKDGTRQREMTAKTLAEMKTGDRVTCGQLSGIVESTIDRNPDGRGAIVWTAVLR